MTELQYVTLDSLDKGGAVEMFQSALIRAAENIADPNTDATAVRTVVLEVSLKPTAARVMANVKYQVKTKLPGPNARETAIRFRNEGGVIQLEELRPVNEGQMDIEHYIEEGKVARLNQGGE